ncbi:hypothetical protein [Streptomyces rubradiris]|uniref:hypothetical protein n=1 Tax=Streptomyces rubradiris TaxID=285531 RepID=UPI001672BDCA|nr:hypothetical protein [Streptomyces rubradiris]
MQGRDPSGTDPLTGVRYDDGRGLPVRAAGTPGGRGGHTGAVGPTGRRTRLG